MTDALRLEIISNTLPAGERLRQDAIAARFGVSQMIVREAFKQLVTERLLHNEPRRGVRVASLLADEAQEISQLRALIEARALQWAIPRADLQVHQECARILDSLDAAASVDEKIALNARFHATLYAPCGKERTLEIIESLRRNFERYLRFTWEKTHYLDKSQAEHREILALCARHESETACALLQHHILSTGKLLVACLNTATLETQGRQG